MTALRAPDWAIATPYRVSAHSADLLAGHSRVTLSEMSKWTRYTTAGKEGQRRPTQHVEFGPGEVDGLDRRLLGDVEGHRILELGAGAGHSAIALAKQGARVVAIDPAIEEIETARAAAEVAEVHIELHNTGLADLASLPADAFDAVVAIHSLASVSNIDRVFRQVHRLLKSDRPLVISLPHPAALMIDPDDSVNIVASYAEAEPLGTKHHLTYRHGIGDVFTQLTRANFRVDTLLEPAQKEKSKKADGPKNAPASVIFRARKIGT